MYVPSQLKEIGDFATDIVHKCSASMRQRVERGAMYRSTFLTGDPNGTPQIYKKTYAYIDDLASILYSPVELKLRVNPHGRAGPRERALGHATASVLNEEFRGAEVDATIEDAVIWSLIKGKTFIQLLWNKAGFEPHLIMPEQFGVMEEGKSTLAAQKAFFHRTWITLDDFRDRIRKNKNRSKLLKSVQQYSFSGKNKDQLDEYQTTRMVMLGGLYPYQVGGSPIPGQSPNRGIVDWLSAPQPQLAPETLAELIALDEVWVWDSSTEDWVTIQLVGPDCVLTPTIRLSNAFADYVDPTDPRKRVAANEDNPLSGKHPFVEFCVNRTPGYFWGDSEVRIVGSIQQSINARIDGIQKMLRKQEDPPRIISGASINQNALAKLKKPGGYLTDPSPNLKHEELTPKIPTDFYTWLHELGAMYNDVGGMPAVARGEGESGVRSQGHAETLVRMASPRFKDRAIAVERSIDNLGGLALDILKAKNGIIQVAWVKEAFAGPFKEHPLDPLLYEPPAPGLFGIEFFFHHVGDNQKVSVDEHSSSPIFSADARQLLFTLAKLQAIGPKDLLEATHPPREEELVENFEEREAEKAAFLKQHPDLLKSAGHGGHHR